MFGFGGLPDMNEMVRQVEDWKNKLERLVSAVEKIQADQALILQHLGVNNTREELPVIEAEFTEAK